MALEHSKSIHLYLATQNFDGLITHLKTKGIPYWDWPGKENAVTNRADGVQQIYIQGPENNWIEINTAKH